MSFAEMKQAIAQTDGLQSEQVTACIELLISGTLSEAEGAELLGDLADRGEKPEEIAHFVTCLKKHAIPVPLDRPCLDVCGTGGSGLTRFNVSTTVAFICAAAGIPVAKHGNRGSKQPNGSFDLLDELGIRFDVAADKMPELLKQTHLVFLFARSMHPAVGKVVPYRKALGRRSIFNLAGPLANPAHISHQIIGCITKETADILAGALECLPVERACVVWGHPGIDEFSVTGPSQYYLIENGTRSLHTVETAMHAEINHATLPGGDAVENAKIFYRLLAGEETGPLRDMVLINAAAAIDCWYGRPVDGVGEGYAQAKELLESGAVQACFEKHKAVAASLV